MKVEKVFKVKKFNRGATVIRGERVVPEWLSFIWDNQPFFKSTPVLSGEAPCWREVYESGAMVRGDEHFVTVTVPQEVAQ